MKKAASLILSVALCFSLTVPAHAVNYAPYTYIIAEDGTTITFEEARLEHRKTKYISFDYEGEEEWDILLLSPTSTVTVTDQKGQPTKYILLGEENSYYIVDNNTEYGYLLGWDDWNYPLVTGAHADTLFSRLSENLDIWLKECDLPPRGNGALAISLAIYENSGYSSEMFRYSGKGITIQMEDGNAYPAAYASTQSVTVNGTSVEFQCYALKDANGNDTNYIKLRDVAGILNGTAAQFEVGWDGAVNIETGKAYTPNGSEMSTPFSGNRSYENAAAETRINGVAADLNAIVLKDDAGGAFTYYKLRDLGEALGFRVDWSAEKGIFIETE